MGFIDMMQRIALGCMGIFAALALVNSAILLSYLFTRRHASMIFLFGGVFGAVGFLLMPSLRPFAWLPLLLDPATATFLGFGLPMFLLEMWRTSRFNLVSEYAARLGIREVQLRLYRKQVFTLRQSFARSPGEFKVLETSTIGCWHREDDRLVLRIGEQRAVFESVASGEVRVIRQSVGFPSYEADVEMSLAGVELTCEEENVGQQSGGSHP